jgi:pimeloyl-ACP methyl ester carboxylesterase
MAAFVLVPGAGGVAWYWHRVVPLLEEAGHDAIAVDLAGDDEHAGLSAYADRVIDAIGARHVILVAQSLAGFTAPLVCERVKVDLLVMVAAMVPSPGESPGDWWRNTGFEKAKREQDKRDGRPANAPFDVKKIFFHDVPAKIVEAAFERGAKEQSGTPMEKPWPLRKWPDVPTRFILCRHDRFFPADFMRRLVKERLGITPDEMECGHLPALARPRELVERLERYRSELAPSR